MIDTIAKILLIVFGVFLLYQIVIRIPLKILRRCVLFPTPAFLGYFLDSDLRRLLQPPDEIIQRSGIKEGMQFIDLGCGSGAFAIPMARVVGLHGKLYAIDIQPKMLKQLENKLNKKENSDIKNIIEVINTSAYELPFENDSIDACCMITVLGEIPDRIIALEEVKRILKHGGTLAVTELLIDPHYSLKSTTIRLGNETGFILDRVYGSFLNYTVRFRKL